MLKPDGQLGLQYTEETIGLDLLVYKAFTSIYVSMDKSKQLILNHGQLKACFPTFCHVAIANGQIYCDLTRDATLKN